MTMPTVDWTAPRTQGGAAAAAEGLRERKKRLMRQQLSDTATLMFMERGFDEVRVTEIAEACGVSEKTVFNYFPTKESLILDRLESMMASLKSGLTQPGAEPAEAVLQILSQELTAMTSWLAAQDDLAQASAAIRRFGTLIQASPSLRAHQSDMMDQFTAVAAEILAGRAGLSPDDADRGHRLARPVAHSVPGPVEIPGRHPHPRAGPPGRQRRGQPRRPGHRPRTAVLRTPHP
jgi:AcrR family transcriptional regulator